MGLAASQARFLGITARKSNIEYEGQQVNQQRTALAEEVNALYSKLLSLELPIAPDTTKFYESNYSFEISNTTNNQQGSYIVKNYYENDDGTYYVALDRTYDKKVANASPINNSMWSIVQKDDGYYLQNNTNESTSYVIEPSEKSQEVIDLINSTNEVQPLPSKEVLDADGNPVLDENGEPVLDYGTMYFYSMGDGQTYYISSIALQEYLEAPENEKPEIFSYQQTLQATTETLSYEKAEIIFDDNGRMAQINVPELQTGTLAVETTRTYDTEGYDAALRDYTMGKDEYDKMVADLNAQTESLQQEDKVLELRLNQIDTEQNELQTELEAVKAVLDKNIENTFKTFA